MQIPEQNFGGLVEKWGRSLGVGDLNDFRRKEEENIEIESRFINSNFKEKKRILDDIKVILSRRLKDQEILKNKQLKEINQLQQDFTKLELQKS